jgi:hypothetical protein
VVSEDVWNAIDEDRRRSLPEPQPLGEVQVKGRSQAVRVLKLA